jgi:hypothetical protein
VDRASRRLPAAGPRRGGHGGGGPHVHRGPLGGGDGQHRLWAVFSIIPLLLVADVAVALGLGGADRHLGFVIALAVDVGLFVAAFRILTSRDVVTRQVLPGALLSGLVFWVPQELSSLLTPGTCSMPARSTAASPR